MRIAILFFTLCFSLFAITPNAMLEKAKTYEEAGETNRALLWYKRAAEAAILPKKPSPSKALTDQLKTPTHSPQHSRKIYTDYLSSYEDEASNETIAQMLLGTFGLRPYKSNYVLPITYNGVKHADRKQLETKFQFSFQKEIAHDLLGLDETYALGYTQTSWWQTFEKSSPFRETNYQPELFVTIPYKDKKSFLKAFKVGFLHESNGQPDPQSRSWNRLYASTYFQIAGLFVTPRLWYRLPEPKKEHPLDDDGDDNPDIHRYLGYGDLTLFYPWGEHLFRGVFRNNLSRNNNRGSAQLEWTFPLFSANSFGFLQYFYGYGESLIDYDEPTNRIGVGFALSR